MVDLSRWIDWVDSVEYRNHLLDLWFYTRPVGKMEIVSYLFCDLNR
ncbi:hypothetical protein Hanom_Chr13g01226931 [Helianthus anomalus]